MHPLGAIKRQRSAKPFSNLTRCPRWLPRSDTLAPRGEAVVAGDPQREDLWRLGDCTREIGRLAGKELTGVSIHMIRRA